MIQMIFSNASEDIDRAEKKFEGLCLEKWMEKI